MERVCECCGRSYTAKRKTSRFCSDVCRTRTNRGAPPPPLRVVEPAPERPKREGSLLGSVMVELSTAGVLDTAAGRLAVQLATRLDDPNSTDSGTAVAALSRELRAVMTEATASSTASVSPLTKLREGLRVV